MAVGLGKNVTVAEMQSVIARAGLATRSGSKDEIIRYIRGLGYYDLLDEYHRAVVTLASRGLLSQKERQEVTEYARDFLGSPAASGSELEGI